MAVKEADEQDGLNEDLPEVDSFVTKSKKSHSFAKKKQQVGEAYLINNCTREYCKYTKGSSLNILLSLHFMDSHDNNLSPSSSPFLLRIW